MEREDDVQLIRKILSGDDDAFNTLVQKYRKSVHTLVWRKIGDFHYAEEITQDTFLQVYEKLPTLKAPNQFAGWLYVIANRLCIAWVRKQKPAMQSLDASSVKAIDNLTYERYILEQRELEATERRHEIVDGLLTKLPERERTVMTLYYLGEMTAKEIGDFLSVSVNTIRSRLHRARKRLQETGEFFQMPSHNQQQNLATQITNHHRSGEFDKALEISARVLESNPANLEAYSSRWRLIGEMFPEEEARKKICPEIEYTLRTQPETSEVLDTAYWGYMSLPNRTKNVPNSLFDQMLRYPRTQVYLTALLGLAERSEDASHQWHYYQRVIDECTASDVPGNSWYFGAYEHMLWLLAEEDRSLASDDYLDELIDRYLKVRLSYCKETQQYFGLAYIEAVEWRLKFNNRLDKVYEILERAEIRLGEAEEQKWLVEHNKGSVEKAYKKISRLRAEISFQQERWKEAYDGLVANAPDYLESPSERFSEDTTNYFYMLGRSAEGMGDWETARRSYADAHFAPTPHVEARAGLERVYDQIERGSTDTFEAFLKAAETEYRIREDADREKIRQRLITSGLNRKAPGFCLQTLQGETYTLSAMSGKIVLLDIGSSRTRVHNRQIPEVKIVYERFSKNDDVVILGINDDITTHQVRKFINGHQVPWPILLDPNAEVRKAYQIIGIPCVILIDKVGNWQYICRDLDPISGQPLIWMIEALLSDEVILRCF
ncbi:MAG: sigma-70 family RNA polymerase sigma factor [Candidatus Poribacteria bacterium]|nr:sigma-70 family RNA polymerase sigma factor [Candidatus Poribacteria bacterium]